MGVQHWLYAGLKFHFSQERVVIKPYPNSYLVRQKCECVFKFLFVKKHYQIPLAAPLRYSMIGMENKHVRQYRESVPRSMKLLSVRNLIVTIANKSFIPPGSEEAELVSLATH